jgi:ABC-type lipoprotein release transport system permease subunit
LIGALVGTGLILLFSRIGVPGIIFFPDGLLFPSLYWEHYIYAYLLVVGTSILATFFPLLSVKKLKVVDMLKEGR